MTLGRQTVTAACPMAKLEFKIFGGAQLKVNIIHLTSTTCRGMHYNINYFEIHPERLKETLA